MKVLYPLSVLAVALILAPQANAHDDKYRRFAVTAGVVSQNQSGEQLVPVQVGSAYPGGTDVDHGHDDTNMALSAAWFATRNIAIELWGAGKSDASTEIDVENAPDVHVARYQTQPVALSAQYHFTQLGDTFTPFIGLGYHQTKVSGVQSNPALAQFDGLRIKGGNGPVATVGLDANLSERWFVRGDVRYMRWNGESYVGAQRLADGSMSSLNYGASVGLRF